jgi:S1-C subfamily serine protease
MTNILQQLNADLSGVVDGVHRSLVQIRNGHGAGAGTIWHSEGLIVTNAHVIAGRHSLKVVLPDGRTLRGSCSRGSGCWRSAIRGA